MAKIHMELPSSARGIIQNNFVRVLVVEPVDLDGIGTIEKQLCSYVLSLDTTYRTIQPTDSKWNLVLGYLVYEIIDKGKGVITEIKSENLLLITNNTPALTPAIDEVDYDYDIKGDKDGVNQIYYLRKEYVPGTLAVWLNGVRQTAGNFYDFREGTGNILLMMEPPCSTDIILATYKSKTIINNP